MLPARAPPRLDGPRGLAALAAASAALARLDEAAARHPLRPALLHRARLEASRRQAAADGLALDPWRLAAALAGLPLRALRESGTARDAGEYLAATRLALDHHRWTAGPEASPDPEAARAALDHLAAHRAWGVAAADAAWGAWLWIEGGGARPPLRAALARHWVVSGTLRDPWPLSGEAALAPGRPWRPDLWVPAFLDALASEASDTLVLLREAERGWRAARAAVAGRRSTSRAPAAVDLLAALPLVSASTLAAALGLSAKGAGEVLADLVARGVAVEVTRRASRRLYALPGLALLREEAAPPRRPVPGRGRGRPRKVLPEASLPPHSPSLSPLAPADRWAPDYAELEEALRRLDQALKG